MKPVSKRRTSTVVPTITVTSKAFKSGQAMKTAPYWRFAGNNAFMSKYFPTDPKIKKLSIYVGGQGVLMDTKPAKDQPYYLFRKGNYFNDELLINTLFKHFEVPIKKAPEITTIHLFVKPFGKFDEKVIHELIYIDDENPDTTQLAGLKQKMESDENFPEPDTVKPQTIKIEG
jgi:hypothetical protein